MKAGRRLQSRLRRLAESAAAAVFPYRCLVCGSFFRPTASADCEQAGFARIFDSRFEGLLAGSCAHFVCRACAADFIPAVSPLCSCCGMVFQGRIGRDHLCGRCLVESRQFGSARAYGVYGGTLLVLVHQLKYRGRTVLGAPLGRLLYAAFVRWFSHDPPDLIIPVPLHARRLRQRGFNQAYQLVRGWPSRERSGIAREVLVRRRPTPPQTGLGRRDRRKNIRGAFTVADGKRIDGKRILLIDDVMTTGATLNECAGVLRSAGAARVDCLTLARSL